MVIQILRFVSPHPWGSHTAEVFRKSAGLDRIVASLFGNGFDYTCKKRSAFSAGSHVLWTPVFVRPDGQLKYTKPVSGTDGWTEGWLASRSPPYRSADGPSGLELDITSLVLDKESPTNPVEVLYDNRFILSIDLHATPGEVFKRLQSGSASHRLVVAPTGKYFLPRLLFRLPNGNAAEDIAIPGPISSGVESPAAVSGIYGYSSEGGWASWRLARVFD